MAQGLPGRLSAFVEKFKSFFILPNSSADIVSRDYLNGLFLSDQSNCEKISEKINRNSQSLNHFISNSPWDSSSLMGVLAQSFVKLLPKSWKNDLCLAIDESSFPKKGNKSTGVAHQYCGQLGKVANCQVGVFASLICRDLYCLLDALLYLPKKWCEMKGIDIPIERKEYKSKIDLALESIIRFNKILKIPFKWICFDSFYGRDQNLLYHINKMKLVFVADIPRDATLYVQKPKLYIPESKGTRGRKNTKYRIRGKSITAEGIAKKVKPSEFKNITIRRTNKGKTVEADYCKKSVYIALKEEGTVMEVNFIIRKDKDGIIKYILTNAKNESLERVAYMHGQRYFIERSFQEAKQQLGMGDYQVRGYLGWHRHMAMTMMGMLFIQEEKLLYMENNWKLTTPVLTKIIKLLLPKKITTLTDILNKIPPNNRTKPKQNKNHKKSVT